MEVLAQILSNLSAIGFSNLSVASIERQIAIVIAVFIANVQSEITNSESIITNLLISQQGYGKSLYYTGKALEFQYGDNLAINTDINPVTGEPYLNYYYPVIDATKQIISQAAFSSSSSGLFLKVATLTGGILGPLSSPQYNAFSSYMLNFEILSLPVNIISIAGNVLRFTSIATYISAYDLPTLQANLATALTAFQNTFQFNGTFYAGDLESYVKANVPGMRDFYIANTTIDGVSFSDSTNLSSGYFLYSGDILTLITYNAVVS